jgi:hypothetical protein
MGCQKAWELKYRPSKKYFGRFKNLLMRIKCFIYIHNPKKMKKLERQLEENKKKQEEDSERLYDFWNRYINK